MRYLILIVVIYTFSSCKKEVNNQAINDYSVDTVIVDSKERLLDLKNRILISDLDSEERSLFLYNSFDHSVDEVNLDDLEFVNSYNFEVEGPDGTGEHVNYFNISNEGLFFFKSFGKSGVFNRNGQLVQSIEWGNLIDSNSSKYTERPQNELLTNYNDLKVFGLSYDNKNRNVFLDVLSVQDSSVKRFDIDPEKSYHNFVLELGDPKYPTFIDPFVYMVYENYLIVSHHYSSELILFNSEGKFVKTVYYNPKMTPTRVQELNERITSSEQIQKEYQHFLEQVRFGPPVWDSIKKRYLRLSAKRIFSDTLKEGSLLPETQEVKVFLTVFDAEFNLVSELAVPELNSEFVKYFAKDGRLWVAENFSDELGFIIIDV